MLRSYPSLLNSYYGTQLLWQKFKLNIMETVCKLDSNDNKQKPGFSINSDQPIKSVSGKDSLNN